LPITPLPPQFQIFKNNHDLKWSWNMGDGNSTGVNKLTKTIRQERIPKNGTEDNDLAPMIWNFAFGV